MSNITLTAKGIDFSVKNYEVISEPKCAFIFNIEKESYTVDQLKELLSTASTDFYEVNLDDQKDGAGYGFNTEHYKLISVEERAGNTIELNYTYLYVPVATEIEKLNSKVDYIAIMADIEIEED